MAVNPLLAQQLSTQVTPLGTNIQPGAAFANIIGGVGKTYALGEQMKMLEQQRMQEAQALKAQQDAEQQARLQQAQAEFANRQSLQNNKIIEDKKNAIYNSMYENEQKGLFIDDKHKGQWLKQQFELQGLPFGLESKIPAEGISDFYNRDQIPTTATFDTNRPGERIIQKDQDITLHPKDKVKSFDWKDSNEKIKAIKSVIGEKNYDRDFEYEISQANRALSLSEKAFDSEGYNTMLGMVAKFAPDAFLPKAFVTQSNNLNALKRIIKDKVLDNAQRLSGQMSDKDLEILADTIATLDDTKKTRKLYFQLVKANALKDQKINAFIENEMEKTGETNKSKLMKMALSQLDEPSGGMPIAVYSKGELLFTDEIRNYIKETNPGADEQTIRNLIRYHITKARAYK